MSTLLSLDRKSHVSSVNKNVVKRRSHQKTQEQDHEPERLLHPVRLIKREPEIPHGNNEQGSTEDARPEKDFYQQSRGRSFSQRPDATFHHRCPGAYPHGKQVNVGNGTTEIYALCASRNHPSAANRKVQHDRPG